jgi:hypothetical protein
VKLPEALAGPRVRNQQVAGSSLAGGQAITLRARRRGQPSVDAVGKDVLLCDGSTWLWEGDEPPHSDENWRVFNRFTRAIKEELGTRQRK